MYLWSALFHPSFTALSPFVPQVYQSTYTTWYFMNNSILLPFFRWWYSMVVGFSTYVMTSDFSLFFMSHWNIERSKSFVLFRRKKNCMTQQQPHIVLTILTPFLYFHIIQFYFFILRKPFLTESFSTVSNDIFAHL